MYPNTITDSKLSELLRRDALLRVRCIGKTAAGNVTHPRPYRRIRRWLTTETQRPQRGNFLLPDRETTIGQNLASPSGNI